MQWDCATPQKLWPKANAQLGAQTRCLGLREAAGFAR
jgi:hypothetical protein